MSLLLAIKRELGLAAPASGECEWSHTTTVTTTYGDRVTHGDRRYVCRRVWQHPGDHDARLEEPCPCGKAVLRAGEGPDGHRRYGCSA